ASSINFHLSMLCEEFLHTFRLEYFVTDELILLNNSKERKLTRTNGSLGSVLYRMLGNCNWSLHNVVGFEDGRKLRYRNDTFSCEEIIQCVESIRDS
ncbi:hypothetical protein PFISCL1PPCAC_3253, partial [Pristionchus fissidentatus]